MKKQINSMIQWVEELIKFTLDRIFLSLFGGTFTRMGDWVKRKLTTATKNSQQHM